MTDADRKREQFLNIAVLVVSIFLILAAFFPISTYYGYYENISYIKGFSYLLYPLPFFAIGPAIVALYGKLPNEGIWYVVVGAIGLFLTIFTVIAGNDLLTSFIRFNSNITYINPRPGLGTIMLFIGYFLVAFIGYIFITNNKKPETHQKAEIDS